MKRQNLSVNRSMFDGSMYVYAVYSEKSFSKAAEKLYISQPGLSAMVKKVETRLGVPLFYRNTRQVELTEYGKEYIAVVERIMEMEDAYESYLADVRNIHTGHITIGSNCICSAFVLPKMIRRFKEMYPQIQIELREGNPDHLEGMIKDGELDLILDNYPVDGSAYETQPLLTERLLVAVPEDLAGSQLLQHPDFRDFREFQWIIPHKGNDTRSRFEELCREAAIEPKIMFEVDQLMTAFHIAANGLGIALVSNTLLRHMPESSSMQLHYYPIESKLAERQLLFRYPKNRYRSLSMERFLEMAREWSE